MIRQQQTASVSRRAHKNKNKENIRLAEVCILAAAQVSAIGSWVQAAAISIRQQQYINKKYGSLDVFFSAHLQEIP
jgi:hypothetical protein